MTQVDVNMFLGEYPFRDIGRWDTPVLLREMTRVGTDEAWVSHLGAIYRRDAAAGNAAVYAASAFDPRLRPIPVVHPTQPGWVAALDEAVTRGAPAVRSDPTLHGQAAAGDEMRQLLAACAERRLPLMMAVRLEDIRQRHPDDVATDLQPWAVRQLIRSHPTAHLIITHADREFIEQVHFGSTPEEAARLLWDICWVWGPPEDHLELLLRTVGIERFTFGTGVPLRLPETSVAKLHLLNLDAKSRARVTAGNLRAFTASPPS